MRLDVRPTWLFAAVAAALLATPAAAGDTYGDRVHADTFGNLVVYSAAGYKRIVVGKGYLAPEFARLHGTAGEESYYEEAAPAPAYRPCRRPPAMFKGRSYMYGLPDHVVPVPGDGYCE